MRLCRPLCLVPALILLSLTLCRHASGQTALPLLNGDFETSLSGWAVQGHAVLATAAPLHGKASLRLGPGKSAVQQRIAIGGLQVLLVEATLRAVPARAGGVVRARCYDAQDRLLLDLRQGIEAPQTERRGSRLSLYFKTQAHTAYVVLSIEKDTTTPGYIDADNATVTADIRERRPLSPRYDLNQAMQPLWQGKTVYQETVLLLAQGGNKPATGRLLFTPTKILSVEDYANSTAYIRDRDYTLTGKTLTATPGTRMPTARKKDLTDYDYQWYKLNGRHVVVTYTHDEAWSGPRPTSQDDRLPRTLNRLRHHLPLTIVTQGDSITLGNDVSSFLRIPPYMPTWPELLETRLKAVSGDDAIQLYNTALGGATAAWGLENADSTVATLDPDLVIIAFGMNDVWSVPTEQYRADIRGIIRRVRARRPEAEFILLSPMRYDPDYAPDVEFKQRLASYAHALQSLTGPGVCLLDMHALSGALFAAKKPKDFVSNPMHPNDFLARWYAQSLVAMLDPSSDAHSPHSAEPYQKLAPITPK